MRCEENATPFRQVSVRLLLSHGLQAEMTLADPLNKHQEMLTEASFCVAKHQC